MGVAWGAFATLFTSFYFFLGPAVVVLGILLLRNDRAVAISGPLVGFGGAWLLWIARQAWSGGTGDPMASAILFGALPLAVGIVALLPILGGTLGGRQPRQY